MVILAIRWRNHVTNSGAQASVTLSEVIHVTRYGVQRSPLRMPACMLARERIAECPM